MRGRDALVVLVMALAGCVETLPSQSRVHVVLSNLGATLSSPMAIEIDVYFIRVAGDAGAVDGGRDQGPQIRREFVWDRMDRTEFDVEIPAGSYVGARFEAIAPTDCPNGLQLLTIATGTSTTPLVIRDQNAPVMLQAVAATPTCH
jgi:hypothetical protein